MRHGRAAQRFACRCWHFGCNSCSLEGFLTAVGRFAFSVAILMLVANTLFAPRVVTSSLGAPVALASTAATTDGPNARRAQQEAAGGTVDLYGNEVSDAIATYSLDPAGSLYELHSPQTELPKLPSPKS
jgi:hypothetical protein